MEEGKKLFISNLPEIIDEHLLHNLFLPFGEIKEVIIPQKNHMNKGFGFVEFIEKEDAYQALLNMNKSEVYGKYITVTYYHKK